MSKLLSIATIERETLRILAGHKIGGGELGSRMYRHQFHVDAQIPDEKRALSLDDLAKELLAPIANNLAGVVLHYNARIIPVEWEIPPGMEGASDIFYGCSLRVVRHQGDIYRFDVLAQEMQK